MRSFRSIFRSHRWLAALVLLAALLLRIAVPAGFMPMVGAQGLRLVPCSGYGTMPLAPASDPHTISGDHHSEAHAGHGEPAPHAPAKHAEQGDAQAQSGCAFAELAVPLMPNADPIQLLAAIFFIIAAALFFRAHLPRHTAPRLRPPLRGPPLPA
ncbi:hypothetical protein LQ953_00315 [Sphingomonas sp. IC-56]|uniref:hypothetical protein n=1 Tax=Sphingomonas sp. IC-56 TaxID=2898529 RepID=UPI001E2CD222|nr:hypothetical protein [Sphingomonas sp. IC-56]MCD2322457.1 hypothetical protein [Sphingomonas sp. IC-56]